MKGFVQGTDRQQTTLLPERLDDWVDESNAVRAVDVFVDEVDDAIAAAEQVNLLKYLGRADQRSAAIALLV
jgi:transposase